jgi:hypothetical protein
MYTLKNSKFETMLTEMYDRFTNGGGFLKGDVVRLKKDVTTSDWFKQQADSVKEKLKNMIGESNRVYRISALKSEVPRAAGSFGMGEPRASVADVVREINPSFWMDPVTVPLQYLESIDVGVNMPPYDQDLVRKDTSHIKPEEKGKSTDKVGAEQTKVDDKERQLPDSNTKLENGEDWDDKKPGAGNMPHRFLKRDRRQKQAKGA